MFEIEKGWNNKCNLIFVIERVHGEKRQVDDNLTSKLFIFFTSKQEQES